MSYGRHPELLASDSVLMILKLRVFFDGCGVSESMGRTTICSRYIISLYLLTIHLVFIIYGILKTENIKMKLEHCVVKIKVNKLIILSKGQGKQFTIN